MIESEPVSESLPAFQQFLQLRRKHKHLGISDYLLLLEAIKKGYGAHSRESLIFTCSTLWGKSLDEQDHIERFLQKTLPDTPKPEENTDIDAEDSSVAEPDLTPDSASPEGEETGQSPTENVSAGDSGNPETSNSETQIPAAENKVDASAKFPVDTSFLDEAPSWQTKSHFELQPREPVPTRLLRRIWRGYRRAARSGPKVELDTDAVIAQLWQYGALIELPLRPKRVNQSRLLLLVDEGGSMKPFRYITKALIEAVQSAGLARLEVRYFHDVPHKTLESGSDPEFTKVYEDSYLREGRSLDSLASDFVDQGVMIFSDAGAARGHEEDGRVEATSNLISMLLDVTPTVVWLNPVPRQRWGGSTAKKIEDGNSIPMYPFSSIGLRSAVAALHGKEA